MLTNKDLEDIEKLIDEKIKLLPTKEEFFSRMDKLMGEVKTMRESQELHANSHSEIKDDIENLKKAVFPKN